MAKPLTSIQMRTLNGMIGIIHGLATCPDSDQETVGRYLTRISELPAIRCVLGEESCQRNGETREVCISPGLTGAFAIPSVI